MVVTPACKIILTEADFALVFVNCCMEAKLSQFRTFESVAVGSEFWKFDNFIPRAMMLTLMYPVCKRRAASENSRK